ncbi:asparagine synthase-related protein [Parerythrobacter aestuarii]|uniref:asparagine synthase-related protein n=1 Tax=Parerythrobacter aestuarii TaxID=3020909 RepID=UPI0024DEB6D7|nr:asparagine synthase-related protein [Parerythrobacter aestuarii]
MLAAVLDPLHIPATALGILNRWIGQHGLEPGSQEYGKAVLVGARERCGFARRTLFDGWIDNNLELADLLGVDQDDPAALYDAAIDAWGATADEHIIGHYAAITALPDGALRLARSPLGAPPLLHGRIGTTLMAASLPGAFFALGYPQTLDWEQIADRLAMDIAIDPAGSGFAGISRVPLGSIVTLCSSGTHMDRWYARRGIPATETATDDEVLKRVSQLLADACDAALRPANQPALALSGGLDSSTVADELLRQMDGGQVLHGVTFDASSPDSTGTMPGMFDREWPMVERFAKMHEQLRVHRTEPAQGGFDHRFREIATLAGTFNPGLAHFGAHHGVWEAARSLGCDWLFGADLGNQSFSADGRWSYAEDFRGLRWKRLASNLHGRANDPRPFWRKFLALGLLPNLPRALRVWVKRLVRPARGDVLAWNSPLSARARVAYRRRARDRGSAPAWEGFAFARSRAEAARRDLAEQDHECAEITLALELRYGLRYRDVTAYRPLVEYCMRLPTRMFVRDGVHRWLARELAKGRMPEEQRLESRYGRHGADWHAHMAPRESELLDYLERIERHPQLALLLDTARMKSMLENFPASDSSDEFDNLPYTQGLARGLLAAQFVGVVEGLNEL